MVHTKCNYFWRFVLARVQLPGLRLLTATKERQRDSASTQLRVNDYCQSQVSFRLLVIPYPPFSTMNGIQRNATNEEIMGKIKRLEFWWQLYITWLPVRDLENFRLMDFCWTECTSSLSALVLAWYTPSSGLLLKTFIGYLLLEIPVFSNKSLYSKVVYDYTE